MNKFKKRNKKKNKKEKKNKSMQELKILLIVGGGISGLYCYYKLLKERKINPKNSVLFEKYSTLGGRIQTKKIKKNNIIHSFEGGAGRFSSNHTLLIQLIKELKLN